MLADLLPEWRAATNAHMDEFAPDTALNHAARHGHRRIIFTIPFTLRGSKSLCPLNRSGKMSIIPSDVQ